MDGWLNQPWFVGYAALRSIAALDWTGGRNKKSGKSPWDFLTGAMQHFSTGIALLRLAVE